VQRFQVAGPPASPFDAPLKLRLDALWVSPADELPGSCSVRRGPSQLLYRHTARAKLSDRCRIGVESIKSGAKPCYVCNIAALPVTV
jgi:hypothetical protein